MMNPKMSLSPPQQQFPAMNSPQRAGSSSLSVPGGSSSRIKVSLKPGRSLMDWVRLGKQQGRRLNGVQGQRMEVTEEELAKHNKIDDGWLAIRGKVYNVTPYMEYHPGGAEELERGLGKDATDLFNEVHRWVNVESMLEKCHIGSLQKGDPMAVFKVPDKKTSPSKPEETGSYTIKWPDTVEDIPWYMCKLRGRDNKVRAKHDWYQMGDQVVISIYAKCMFFTTDHVIIDLKEKTLKVTLYLDSQYFTLHLELPEEVHPNVKVTQRKGNMPIRCDLWLKKKNPNIKWTTLGLPLDDHKKTAPTTDYEPCFRTCTLRKRTPVTHDTYLMTFDLPEGTQFKVPFGYHVYLKANVHGEEVSRPYTPVYPSLKHEEDEEETDRSNSKCSIHLMLKIYPQGLFTQHLATLKEGDEIEMSNHDGNFNHECTYKQLTVVYFIAAGTGFTPMVKLIQRGLAEDSKCKFRLLFFNKTQKDIVWREHLDECVEQSKGRFEVTHILSTEGAPSWTGHTGRISKELLNELIPKHGPEDIPVFAICGPTPFMNTAFQLLLDAGYTEKCICLFSG
ncbi:cytochrome b5 reductase 4-like isoform X2 [Lytechinus pictus]